jgi:predicted tellurium resistance membrane protein TerC
MTSTSGLVSLLTLTAMEIVLGIDNIVFVAILVGRLPLSEQARTRRLGIGLALILRLALLFSISWVMDLTSPLFGLLGREVSGRDLILIAGGLFLMAKATHEIHQKLEAAPESGPSPAPAGRAAFVPTLIQILLLDIVFSLDSVITAVGMARELKIMVAAMVLAVLVMLAAAGTIGDFVHRHPTIKILALSFLLMIGTLLLMDGLGAHVDKGYLYFAMAFSLGVELINMRYRKRNSPVRLHEHVP